MDERDKVSEGFRMESIEAVRFQLSPEAERFFLELRETRERMRLEIVTALAIDFDNIMTGKEIPNVGQTKSRNGKRKRTRRNRKAG